MTFLPVVERELRVSARKRSTFWSRVVAAIVALVIGTGFLILSWVFGRGTAGLGGALFGTLTWLALAATLSAGLFFTADSLSEEKREGTLGFLFLTDLRGYDVAGGKLLATSLRGSYALLAFFPVLAITLLMGGVTGAQFWKTTLALVNVLFLSLALGLFVSAISRDPQKAMGGTFLLLLLTAAGGPLIDSVYSGIHGTAFKPILTLTSPVYVFYTAGGWHRAPYWLGLLVNHLTAWIMLALACLMVPRTWQDRARRPLIPNRSWVYAWKYGAARARLSLREKLLEKDPVLWLASRERWQGVTMWAITGLAVAIFGLCLWKLPAATWIGWGYVAPIFAVALYLWAASQACSFFIDVRRTGFLELLMITPVGVRQIVQGQWRAVVRLFGAPILLFLALDLAGTTLGQLTTWGRFAGQSTGAGPQLILAALTAAASFVTIVANLVALIWFGMWMGLTSKNVSLAALKTMIFIEVIPYFVIAFASGLIAGLLMFTQSFRSLTTSGITTTNSPGMVTTTISTTSAVTFPLIMAGTAALLALGKDIAFVVWARRRLYSSLREQAARSLSPVPVAPPPVAATPSITPPPVAAPPAGSA